MVVFLSFFSLLLCQPSTPPSHSLTVPGADRRAERGSEGNQGTHGLHESLSSSIGVESQVSSDQSPTTLSRLWLDKEPIDVDWSLYGFEIPQEVLLGGWVTTRDYIRLTTPVPFDRKEDYDVHLSPSHDGNSFGWHVCSLIQISKASKPCPSRIVI